MNKTISFYTFGCRLNQSETAVVQRTFANGGYRVVDFKEPADIVVINTCTVTENGDTDTRRLVNRIARLNPKSQIAIVGCQAQIQKGLLGRLPNVRWVIGNAKKMEMVDILGEPMGEDVKVITPAISKDSFTMPGPGIDPAHTRANIKIQDGCDSFCSFCEIPYARGRARSRVFEDILLEANALVAAGHKELILTGINIGTYRNQGKNLMDVIDALEQITGLRRVRISSIEPTTIPAGLIAKMSKKTKLCRHLHVPLQSGCDETLKAMKRKYTVSDFKHLVEEMSERVPQLCLGTDVIVGFPGETAEQFQESAARLREWPVNYFHVFSYSRRHLARSHRIAGPLSPADISARSKTLRELSARKRRMFYESLINTRQTVLFEGAKKDFWSGLTDNYTRVQVPSRRNLSNQLIDVTLKGISHPWVTGELVE